MNHNFRSFPSSRGRAVKFDTLVLFRNAAAGGDLRLDSREEGENLIIGMPLFRTNRINKMTNNANQAQRFLAPLYQKLQNFSSSKPNKA